MAKTVAILNCGICTNTFTKELEVETSKRKSFKPICPKCTNQKISKGVSKKHQEKIDLLPYEQKSLTYRKLAKWNSQEKKCNKCAFNQYGPLTGPYEMHHIDGNGNNISFENEELLCCNCHAMTDNYRFRNRTHKIGYISKSEQFGGIYTKRKNWVQS